MIKKSKTKYLNHRSIKLKQIRELELERNVLYKELKKLRKELDAWDRWLLTL